MIEIVGYLCAALAALTFWLGGAEVSHQVRWLRLAAYLGVAAGLTGAALAILDPNSPIPLAFLGLAAPISVAYHSAQSEDA